MQLRQPCCQDLVPLKNLQKNKFFCVTFILGMYDQVCGKSIFWLIVLFSFINHCCYSNRFNQKLWISGKKSNDGKKKLFALSLHQIGLCMFQVSLQTAIWISKYRRELKETLSTMEPLHYPGHAALICNYSVIISKADITQAAFINELMSATIENKHIIFQKNIFLCQRLSYDYIKPLRA